MRFLFSLVIAIIACLFLTKLIPGYWVGVIFVYITFTAIVIGIPLEYLLPKQFYTLEKLYHTKILSSKAPVVVVWYYVVLSYVFIPMLVAYGVLLVFYRMTHL